jgi:4-diphosphocytidyl-2-C-methyl-D-erythritol kinase
VTDRAITLAAPAKVNLILHVLERESNGYHRIETLFQRLELADSVTVRATDGASSLDLVWRDTAPTDLGPPEANLAWRAAQAFRHATGWPQSWAIELTKRIPSGAGLGGGSSDAAAVLRALNTLTHTPIPDAQLHRIGAGLGADVPFFLSDTSLALGRGRGEELVRLAGLPRASVVLITPGFPISTAEAYADLASARAKAGRRPLRPALRDADDYSTWHAVASRSANDFETTVFVNYPELEVCRQRLEQAGATVALLSGTGSTVFGVWTEGSTRGLVIPPPRAQLVVTHSA